MKNYDFPAQFRKIYDQAADLYAKGARGAGTYFDKEQTAWLAANGLTPQHMYDYAEDEISDGQPGFGHALAIEAVRRDYFINIQGGPGAQGNRKPRLLDAASLPAKSDSAKGIEWLPRIIPKAKAKLRGELPGDLMYCCGGDRRFFMAHDILPAEFLSLVWRNADNDAATIDWVVARSQTAK